jgi:hypothetical protein
MKKSIIIVVVIAVVILGGFVFLSQSKSGIQGVANDARLKAQQASMKAFVAGTMADLATYYSDVKNTMSYDQNPSVKQSIEAKISVLKEKYPGDYSYKIYDGEDASIKLAETTSSIYVCVDSKTVKVVDISSSEFSKQTDCSGQAIK